MQRLWLGNHSNKEDVKMQQRKLTQTGKKERHSKLKVYVSPDIRIQVLWVSKISQFSNFHLREFAVSCFHLALISVHNV